MSSSPLPDYYSLLQIPLTSTKQEIEKAFRKQSIKFHPDKQANPSQEILDQFHLLQKARDVLINNREEYDKKLKAEKYQAELKKQKSEKQRKMQSELEEKERAHNKGKRKSDFYEENTKREAEELKEMLTEKLNQVKFMFNAQNKEAVNNNAETINAANLKESSVLERMKAKRKKV